jgi:REP element-mobilizing transposase RayT
MGSKLPKRRSIRLPDYDYSQNNAYFVTICTKNGELDIDSDVIRGIIRKTWENLPSHYPSIILDEFVIMPNHVHGIIIIQNESVGAGLRPARKLSEIVRAFKSFSSREINKHIDSSGRSFWQRNYYEHVIRNDDDLYRTRKYIRENPLKWDLDEENPDNFPGAKGATITMGGERCIRISRNRSMS